MLHMTKFTQETMTVHRCKSHQQQKQKLCSLCYSLLPTVFTTMCFLLIATAQLTPVHSLANCPSACQCNDDTLVVKCGEGRLDVLPIALNPSIQRLVIKNNKIKTIDSSMQFYAELTFFDLSYNDLDMIPARTFASQRKLQELHLNHNKIGHINNMTFFGLNALTVLNLRGNLLAELESGTFAAMAQIVELNLGQNRINHIDAHAFDDTTNLRVLYLDDNTLTTIMSAGTFRSLRNLAELYLSANSFSTLQANAFEQLSGLTRLELRSADLHNLSTDAFRGLENLRALDIADNRLQQLPTAALACLERLEELALGENDFESIPAGAFAGLKNLRRLDVSGSQRLRAVAADAFTNNTNLEHLIMNDNRMLSFIDERAFDGLTHLRSINLKHNYLGSLPQGLLAWSDLEMLDVSDNPLICDCRVQWLHTLLKEKNATSVGGVSNFTNVLCAAPASERGKSLSQLQAPLLGCSHSDTKRQAMMAVLLVVIAATITALALVIYGCRRRIREFLKGGGSWGDTALGRKEREYQKTFSDEEYMAARQHSCSMGGIHAVTPYANTHLPYAGGGGGGGVGVAIPVTEL